MGLFRNSLTQIQAHGSDLSEGRADIPAEISEALKEGQLYVGTNKEDPALFTKTSDGSLVRISGDAIDIIKTDDDTEPSDSNVFSSLRSRLEFGRKAVNDIISGAWSFLKRITTNEGVQFGESYASGMTGFGGLIDGQGNGELESLVIRRFLEVPELRYNRVSVELGDKWRAPGAGIIESVDTENKIITLKLEEGEIGAVAVGDICMGIFHSLTSSDNATQDTDDSKGNRTFAGFATVYFTITEIVNTAYNSQFKYQLRPTSTNWGYSYEPTEAMHFVTYGSFSNEDRQTSVYETRTYRRMLWKQNTWEIGVQNIAMQDGDLSNLSVHGLDMTGYSAYLNNVYFTGTITQVKPDGTPVLTANDLGDWKAGHYDYYDRVSHNGSLWLVINEDGTDDEPSSDSPDWLLQVSAGSDGQDGTDGQNITNVGEWYDGIFIPYLGLVRIGNATYQNTNPDGTTSGYMGLADEDSNALLDENDAVLSGGDIDLSGFELIAQDGESGTNGVGVAKVDVEYSISDSNTVAPTDGWQTVAPEWQEGMYIWSRTLTVYTNNTHSYSDAVCISGEDGNGLASVIEQYYLSTSPIYLNGGSWSDTAPTWTSGNYIWTRSIITYTNGNTATTEAICVTGNQGEKGTDGKDGTDGVGVSSVDVLYTISASNTIKPTSGWQTTPPTWESGKYIWSKTQITYTNNTTVETQAVCISGADGNGISNIAEEYYLSTSATDLAGGSWAQVAPTWENGKYIWTRSVITYTNGNVDTTQPICVTGDKGDSVTNVGEWYEGLFIPYLGIVRIGNASYMCVNKDGSTAAYSALADELSASLLDENNNLLSAGDIDLSDFMLVAHDGSDGQNGADGQNGQDGQDGNDGVSIVSTKMEYYLSSSPTELIGDSWSTTYPAWQNGYYLWTRQTVYYDNDTSDVHDPICVSGSKGEDGADGKDGESGAQGLQGCILRDSEWTLGTEYRNDELLTSGTRYIDVALVRDNSTALGWRAYKCLQTHTSTAALAPGNTAYWEEFSAQFVSIFTSLILAKNASIEFISGNQLVVKDEDSNVTAGISGSTAGGKIRIWAGSSDPDTAPFRVNDAGELVATNASITGTINATSGAIGSFTIGENYFGDNPSFALSGTQTGVSLLSGSPSYISFRMGTTIWTGIGTNVGWTGSRRMLGRFSCSYADDIGTIGLYINIAGNPNYNLTDSGNIAIYALSGNYAGFRLMNRRVSASDTLSEMDNVIYSIASSAITLTLPASPQSGQIYFIRKCAAGTVTIAVGSTSHTIRGNYSDTTSTSKQLTNGNLAIVMWDYANLCWTYNYMGY